MAGVHQAASKQAAAAPQLEDQSSLLVHRIEQGKYSGGAGVGMKAEPEVVDEGQIGAVVRIGELRRVQVARASSWRSVAAGSLASTFQAMTRRGWIRMISSLIPRIGGR